MSPGTVGEEAGRLFEALQEATSAWSRGAAPGGQDGDEGSADRPARGAHLPETCGICPVCQAIARLSQARPEVVRHLADATTALVAAFSALAADPAGTHTRPGGPEEASRPATEHIDITD